MKISAASQELIEDLKGKGLAKPNHCYSNAAQTVLGVLKGKGKYVLCWMWDEKGVKHGHAVVEFNGHYFDTTLQANGGFASKYEIFQSFTAAELGAMIKQAGGDVDGAFVPPALLADGKVACVEVSI